MKSITFLGNSLESIKNFPSGAKQAAGYQLDRIQRGLEPTDWKPMASIGQGVKEIRIQHDGAFRVIYFAKLENTICVLHAFQKKSQKTSQRDIDTSMNAFKQLKRTK